MDIYPFQYVESDFDEEPLKHLVWQSSFESLWCRVPEDRRIDEDDPSRMNPWAMGSTLIVGCYLEADDTELPSAALTIRVPPKKKARDVIAEELLVGEGRTWDLLFAWRCGCMHDHRVIYRTLDDFPTDPGVHDFCPRCFCAPLKIVNERGAGKTGLGTLSDFASAVRS